MVGGSLTDSHKSELRKIHQRRAPSLPVCKAMRLFFSEPLHYLSSSETKTELRMQDVGRSCLKDVSPSAQVPPPPPPPSPPHPHPLHLHHLHLHLLHPFHLHMDPTTSISPSTYTLPPPPPPFFTASSSSPSLLQLALWVSGDSNASEFNLSHSLLSLTHSLSPPVPSVVAE